MLCTSPTLCLGALRNHISLNADTLHRFRAILGMVVGAVRGFAGE